ncbi:cytidine deaminase [Corynebacterium sp. AOP36-E1-14]|uniref:cytidine deaminase n=1 Tax=unclassified Corynebacterium TaxID=2624378 RepID=UPI004034688A
MVAECRGLIESRFPEETEVGAAAVLLDDGNVLTGTSPDFANPSTSVCHEIEPYCAAYRLHRSVAASVCLHRDARGRYLVLSPCGVCRERLAMWGPDVLIAVADRGDPSTVEWVTLQEALPRYWLTAFESEPSPWN